MSTLLALTPAGLILLIAAGVWIGNRIPRKTTDAEHRERMRRMVPP